MNKILLPFVSIFLMYRSYIRIESVLNTNPSSYGILISFILAFLITLYITGVFAFIGFVFPTHKLLPTSYYSINNPKLLKKWYKTLCVQTFRKLLMTYFWGRKGKREKYFDGTRNGIDHFIYQTKQSEFGHVATLVLITAITIPILFKGHYSMAIFITLTNIIGNLYPVILQRHHRIRIARLNRIPKIRKI